MPALEAGTVRVIAVDEGARVVGRSPRRLFQEPRVDAGEPDGRHFGAEIDGQDPGVLDVEMEQARTPTAQRMADALGHPPFFDELVDDRGHGARLQAGRPREVGARQRAPAGG